MWATHDVRIVNCSFENQSSIEIDRSEAGTGIYTIDASYIAKASCDVLTDIYGDCPNKQATHPNTFSNLNRGVYSISSGELPGSLQISKNVFSNVKKGITLRGTHNAITVRNSFSSPSNVQINGGENQPLYSIYLEWLINFECTENISENSWGGFLTNSCGIGFNQIYRNTVDHSFYYASTGFGYDSYLLSTGERLLFSCNQYSNNGLIGDIAVTGRLIDQGTLLRGPYNTFTNTNAYTGNTDGWIATNNMTVTSPNPFIYFTPNNSNMIPGYHSTDISLEDVQGNPTIVYTEACERRMLDDVLLKTDTNENVDLNSYYTLLNNLNSASIEEEFERDRLISLIINLELTQNDLASIENLLTAESSNPWRKLQLAEYQRMQEKFVEAKLTLQNLLSDVDVLQEAKDLASIYLIRTNLEQSDKTWFDITSSDLAVIRQFAIQTNELPATLVARNVLELIRGMSFEVRIDEFDTNSSNSNNNPPSTDPTFIIYPNPIVGMLNVEYTGTMNEPFTIVMYELIDNTEAYKGPMEGNLFQMDVSSWQEGFYSILVFDQSSNKLFQSRTHIKP